MSILASIALIVPFLMGMAIGYVFKEWIRSIKKKRKEELLNKKNLDWQDKIRDTHRNILEDYYSMNYHSTSTQGPPRKSAMRFITLEDLLNSAIEEENYENAAKLRDAIKKQNNNEDNNSC